MAPRGRQRKRGIMRMDAALDAMRAYGFPDDLIVKTVKELLTVYGEDGWPFIEDACYKVLLDTILEEVEKEEEQENKNDDATNTSGAENSSRGVHAFSTWQDQQSTHAASSSNEVMDHPSVTNEANENSAKTQESGCTRDFSDHNLDGIKQTSNGGGIGNGCGHGNANGIEGRGNVSCSPTLGTSSTQQRSSNSTQRRKPYHGWLTNDDTIDDQDLVELKPEPLSKELAILVFGTDMRRKRKTMWDMKPGNN